MLSKQLWLAYTDGLDSELQQASEEGREIPDELIEEHKTLLGMENCKDKQRLAREFYTKIQSLPYKKDYPYGEPSDLHLIKALRPKYDIYPDSSILSDKDEMFNRLKGAWFARCAGCLLGKPFESWNRNKINGFLRDTDNYPVNYYASSDISDELLKKYDIDKSLTWITWINNVECMPSDDDTNYTIMGIKLLQSYGKDFTSEDVALCWLGNLPILSLCTAERVAYKNFISLISPPNSASYCNPFREWIGAQIRADFFGYITPVNPELGAELAFRDASISHIKNGIYGEMWVAAMLSVAVGMNKNTEHVMEKIILGGLAQIPANCRLAEDILQVVEWKKQLFSWEMAIDNIHKKYNENNGHQWCHTISNAMVVAAALMYSDCDLEKAIGITVMSGFDTDCNGATVGSVIGMLLGFKNLPDKWISPLNDTILSGVQGFEKVSITSLAEATMKLLLR